MAEISKTEIGFELRKRNCPPNLQPVSDKCRHGQYGLKKRKPRGGYYRPGPVQGRHLLKQADSAEPGIRP